MSLLHDTIAGLGEGVSIFNADLRLVACSARAIDLSGLPAERVKPGVHLRDLLTIQAAAGEFGSCDPHAEVERRLNELKQSANLSYERRRLDGRTIEVRRSPLPDGGFLIVYLDVTARKRAKDELRAFKFVVDSISDMVSVLDPDLKYLMVNEQWCRATGLARAGVLGKRPMDVLPGAMGVEHHRAFNSCLALREQQIVNAQVGLPAQGVRYLETTYYPYTDDSGALIGAVLITRDLTDRRESEMRAQESEQIFRLIANNVPGMMGYWTRELRCAFANPQYQTWFGRSAQEMQGIHMRELLGEKVFSLNEPHIQAVLQGENQQFERTLTKPNGETGDMWAQYIADSVDGAVRGFFVLVSDISALKQSQRDLEKVNETLRIAAIAFEGQEGIIVTDANRVILRVNSAFTRITGFEAREVQGQPTQLLQSDRYAPSFFSAMEDGMRGGSSWQGEMWTRHKDGHDLMASVTTTVVPDADGRLANYVITLIDVTDKHRQLEQRRLDEVAQRNALVREVHHRIKNNLHGITGLLREFAHNHPETAPVLNRAIGQVNSIASIHGLQGHDVASEVHLADLLRAIAAQVREIWLVKVDVVYAPNCIDVTLADTETVPLALVLNELVANAAKHSDRAYTDVRIELSRDPARAMVRVNIVNRGHYRRAPPADQTTGLGLQLVDSLMPRRGAQLLTLELKGEVHTQLDLHPPVVRVPSLLEFDCPT